MEALTDPDRLAHAQELVTAAAPQLQRILDQALDGGRLVRPAPTSRRSLQAAERPDADERMTARAHAVGRGDPRRHARRRRRRVRARARALEHHDNGGPLAHANIRFLGHACFELTEADGNVLIDPFLTGNPKAAASADEVDPDPHPAHARPRRPLRRHRRDRQAHGRRGRDDRRAGGRARRAPRPRSSDPNLGGTVEFDWGWVKFVPAWHTSTTPNGTVATAGGPGGRDRRQDDLPPRRHGAVQRPRRWSSAAHPVDVALVPIGGHYTMDRFDAVDRRASSSGPTASSPATTTRSRRSRPTPRRSRPTSSRDTPSEVGDPRSRGRRHDA